MIWYVTLIFYLIFNYVVLVIIFIASFVLYCHFAFTVVHVTIKF